MDINGFIPQSINFNCWKHHAGFIKNQIEQIKSKKDVEALTSCLSKIGGSQMDLYLGNLSPKEISNEVVSSLKREKIFSSEQYVKWLSKNNKDYQLLPMKDKSVWILRLGENPERYIHIHPGRHSPSTIRVKATTLKTIILILSLKQIGEIKSFETETINQVRIKYLNEPPLKSISKASGLSRLIDLFQTGLN